VTQQQQQQQQQLCSVVDHQVVCVDAAHQLEQHPDPDAPEPR
jgi:hypothetical protein